MQEENSWHDRLSQPIFLKHLNKTHQGIMCETKIKIAYVKKHLYKERKKITNVEGGEENIHHHIYIYIYIYMYMCVCVCVCIKDKHNVCKNGDRCTKS